ncbi:MAG: hypothetical protein R2845_14570 [Thermomicrobiales bacterium]
MQQRPVQEKSDARPRVVDVIAEGLSLIVTRPWLMLVPILLDVVIWLGVKIEPSALINELIDLVDDSTIADTEDVISTMQDLGDSNMTQLAALFVPSMLSGGGDADIYQLFDQRIWTPGAGAVVLVGFGLVFIASLLAMVYTVPIANAIIGRKLSIGGNVALIVRAWARMIAFIVLCVGALMAIIVPTAIMSVIFAPLLPLVTSILMIGAIAALLFFYFVFDAIVIADVGPLKAVRMSVEIVRRNMRAVLGLVLASLLLTTGIPEIVSGMLGSLPGLVLAVLLQAVIATGATAASMFFFVDRLRQWQPGLIELPQTAPAFDLSR